MAPKRPIWVVYIVKLSQFDYVSAAKSLSDKDCQYLMILFAAFNFQPDKQRHPGRQSQCHKWDTNKRIQAKKKTKKL